MDNNETLTVKEMQKYLKIGVVASYKLIHTPGFPVVWISPRRPVISKKALDKWMEANAGNVILGNDAE